MKKLLQTVKNERGFTLIELLVVIGILAILLAITIVAINPGKHFQDTRNTQRSSDVSAILNAIYEYESANSGSEPASVAGVTSAVALGAYADVNASTTAFSTPNLTFTVPSGNIITSGTVDVNSCTNSGNNGTGFTVSTGTDTSITVTNASGVATDATCVITNWSGRVDMCADLVPTYIADMPMDPSSSDTACDTTFDTGYTIERASGRFTIAAPLAEGGATISVTR